MTEKTIHNFAKHRSWIEVEKILSGDLNWDINWQAKVCIFSNCHSEKCFNSHFKRTEQLYCTGHPEEET